MIVNSTKAKLDRGETVFGCFIRSDDANLVEFVALHTWDFLVIDCEHAPLDTSDVGHLVRAAELRKTTPIVRVPSRDDSIVLRHLDVGAHGIQFPGIRAKLDIERAVAAARYPPVGVRGLAGVRAADFGQRGSLAEYVEIANREVLIVVQIETLEAAHDIDSLVHTEGVDVFFIGPTDLSSALGRAGDDKHPEVLEVIESVASTVLANNRVLGIYVKTAADARAWQEMGARYILTGMEGLLSAGIREFMTGARQ